MPQVAWPCSHNVTSSTTFNQQQVIFYTLSFLMCYKYPVKVPWVTLRCWNFEPIEEKKRILQPKQPVGFHFPLQGWRCGRFSDRRVLSHPTVPRAMGPHPSPYSSWRNFSYRQHRLDVSNVDPVQSVNLSFMQCTTISIFSRLAFRQAWRTAASAVCLWSLPDTCLSIDKNHKFK